MVAKITKLDSSWRDWVMTNLRRGCSHQSMVSSMVAKDFDEQFASAVVVALETEIGTGRQAVSEVIPDEPKTRVEAESSTNSKALNQIETTRFPATNMLNAGADRISVLARLTKPEVLVLANVLSEADCAELIRRSEVKLARSTTIDPATGQEIVIQNRTSFGTFFQIKEDDFIARIDLRLSELLKWPIDHAEGLQILRYQVGGEYRPHFDYFPPEDMGSEKHMAQGGQRIGTLVMYLNDVEDGGETIFPNIGLSVVPRRGHAVYFGYCNSLNQVDPLTLHGGAPVRAGVKWIATKWLRQHRRA